VPIGAYADRIVADEDDVESSIYVGFCAYMLALTGQLDECDRRRLGPGRPRLLDDRGRGHRPRRFVRG
jgi:hypothetical protein